jgi:hypothetical protein
LADVIHYKPVEDAGRRTTSGLSSHSTILVMNSDMALAQWPISAGRVSFPNRIAIGV